MAAVTVELIFLIIEDFALVIDVIGVIAIMATLVDGLWPYVNASLLSGPPANIRVVRTRLGHGFILSLDILIAATLLRMVLSPSLDQVAVLAVITVLRIMLALALGYELQEIEQVQGAVKPEPPRSDEAA
jgi:uncharacterized membrane protein